MSSPPAGGSAVSVGSTAVLNRVRVVAVVLAIGVVLVVAAAAMSGDVGLVVIIGGPVAVGAVICWKRPDERVGWLLVVAGLLLGVSEITFGSVEVVNTSVPPPPVAVFGAWLNEWAWIPMLALLFVVLPMLLPDGRPVSPAFGRLLRLIVAVMAAWTVTAMFSAQLADEPAPSLPGVANPVGWLPLDDVENPPTAGYLQATFVLSIVVATVSLVLRYRRSKGRERIQLRWIACGAIATIVGFVAVTAAPLPQSTINWLHAVVIPLMPLSIGVAVLRHNLHDIDRLISRTFAYAAVTALLVATYVVLAVVVPMVVDVRGDLAVAASTVVVAALFNPLRRRVQHLVDRRFNRAHYDATRTVEEFAERLRNQFDAGALIDDLETVVMATMQPTAVSLWLHTRTASDASAQDSSVATGRAQRVAQL
jgi:hypothetical protein